MLFSMSFFEHIPKCKFEHEIGHMNFIYAIPFGKMFLIMTTFSKSSKILSEKAVAIAPPP